MGIGSLVAAVVLAGAMPAHDAALYTTPYFRTLGVAAGLPSSRVYKTVQDHDGYLWFGTQDGLARWDGVGFTVYRHDPRDAGSLGGNVVSALFVDRDGRLWCGTEESGLNLLDARTGRFTHFLHDDADAASLGSDDVWTIAQDAAGTIWVGSYAGGLDRLERGAHGFVHFRHDDANADTIASDNVLGLYPGRSGRLWVGSDSGIDAIEPDGRIAHVDLSSIAPDGRVNAIALLDAGGGAVFAGTRHGLLRIDRGLRAQVIADAALSDRLVYGIAAGAAPGELWIGTRQGLDRRDAAGRISVYTEHPAVPGAFPGETVFDAMRDRDGSLWFATFEGGVVQLPPTWRNFAGFRNDPADEATLSSNRTHGIALDRAGRLWAVNAEGGIDRLDPADGNVERFAARLGASEKNLWSVLPDDAGQLWVGMVRGLRVFELQTGKASDIAVDAARADALAPGLVYHLALAPDGAVWADAYASAGAVHRIDPHSHRVERFGAEAGLRDAEVDQLGFDPAGRLLVASGAGIDRFDAQARRFAPLPGAPAQRVYAFAFAPDSSLWLHVLGALEHYRVSAGGALIAIDRVDAARGWPPLTVGGLQVDSRGAVWVGSPRGLWRYDPGTRTVRVFDERDGLASSEFSRLPLVRRADGAIFGATLAGIVGFVPQAMVEDPPPPAPLLQSVVVRRGGNDVALDARATALELHWDDRDLRIAARALGYVNPGADRYAWKLDGIDADWVDTANRAEREFPQLVPGDYRLALRVANAAGAWSAVAAPLELRVAAPPWAAPAAYAGYAVVLALFAWIALRAYRTRVRRRYALALAEQQRALAEQTSAAKSEFLATMGHEIRTPMTGVLGMAELLLKTPLDKTQSGYARAILDSGRTMLRLVDDSLDLARIEAGRLELVDAPFDPAALLQAVAAIAAPLARERGLDWQLQLDARLPRCVIGDAVRVRQVVTNLVNNALKYTECGAVTLSAARHGDALVIAIADTGPGIPHAAQARLFRRFEQADVAHRGAGSGLGLAICHELVARMDGSIALDSEPGRGSTFRVRLPLPPCPAPIEAPVAPVASRLARPLRVLVVEDDATVADVVRGLLAAQGHDVVLAAHGLAALAESATQRFDVALIDLDLPGVDGLALARMLRQREAQAHAARRPLIGISARSAGNEDALCRESGMDGFLRKPLSGEQLALAFARVVEQRESAHAG